MSEGGTSEKTSIQDLAKGIFADLLGIITEDIVMEAHRTEKVTNMGFFSTDGVPATTRELQSIRNDDAELLAAKVMGRSLRIPIEETICHKCQHPMSSNDLTSVGKKPCQRHLYRVVNGQDMYGKVVPSNSVKVAKGAFKPKVQGNSDTGSRQGTPAIGEENGKPAPIKDPNGSRKDCPVCGEETSFKMWMSKHKNCLNVGADKKEPINNGDSGSGSPLSPDSPSSSFADPEVVSTTKKLKKTTTDPKPPPKKAQVKKDTSESVQKSAITSAPRLEKEKSTASARADSPNPSNTTGGSQGAASASASTKKKKTLQKRKADSLDDDGDKKSAVDPYDIDSHPISSKEKESITPTKPPKKQKTSNTPSTSMETARVSPHPGTPTTKNLVSKLKERTGSPTPTKKDKLGGVDMSRSQSDSSMPRKFSPKPSGLGDKDKSKKLSKPDGSPILKKIGSSGLAKPPKKETSGKSVPTIKKKEKRPTPDRG